VLALSGTELRQILKEGRPIPEWFTYPEVVSVLRKVYPPRKEQGVTLFFTGLSAAGKSTLANALAVKLMEMQDRPVTLLDGDLVRTYLSSELGFSKEHRSLNVRRVGFVASQISKNRGIAICALIAPYEEDRQFNRKLIESNGNYIEIFIDTPLAECEERDPKGLYALARRGKLLQFTGIDDPYERPQDPQLRIDTSQCTVEEGVAQILTYLSQEGYF
jgi:sulfate adenylyltransferase